MGNKESTWSGLNYIIRLFSPRLASRLFSKTACESNSHLFDQRRAAQMAEAGAYLSIEQSSTLTV